MDHMTKQAASAMHHSGQVTGDSQFPQIDRRSGLSVREFKREYQHPRRPVVITDAIEDWKARSSWTFDFFTLHYGKTLVRMHRYEKGEYQPDRIEPIPLTDYIEKILTNDWDSFPYFVRDIWSLFIEHQEL